MAIRANNAALDYHPEAELAGNLLIPFYTSQNLSYIYTPYVYRRQVQKYALGCEWRELIDPPGRRLKATLPREVRGYMHACRQTKLWAHRKLAALDVPHVAFAGATVFGHTGKWRRAVAGDQRSLGRKSIAELRIGCWRKRRLLFRREINRTSEVWLCWLDRWITIN